MTDLDLEKLETLSWTAVENGVQDMALNPSTWKIYSIGFYSGGMHPDALPVTEGDIATRSVSNTIMVSPSADQRAVVMDPGDCNRDDSVDLVGVVSALKSMAEGTSGEKTVRRADVNRDGKVGLEEALYILEVISGLR
jgi:hypothetical protein